MQTSEGSTEPSSTGFTEQRKSIKNALRRLSLLPDVEASGRLERAISTLLLVCAPAPPRRRPNAFTQGTEAMRTAELAELVELATRLADALDGLHGGAIDGLARKLGGLNLFGLADLNRTLAHAAKTAPLPPMSKSGRGAAERLHARGITKVARAEYFALTGRKATYTRPPDQGVGKPSGPILGLLNALYEVAGVQASAEWQIRNLPVKAPNITDLTPFAVTEHDE